MKWNQMIPEFDVFNLKESLHFYIDLIGFNVVYERIEDKFAFIEFENVQIMLQEINKSENKWETAKLEYPLGRGINFQIDVINIDKIYNRLKESKYKIFVDIDTRSRVKDNILIGCKEFLVQDPNGYVLRFSEDLEEKKV